MKGAVNRFATVIPSSLDAVARRFSGFVINPKEVAGIHSAVVKFSGDLPSTKTASVIFVKDAFGKIYSKSFQASPQEAKEQILSYAQELKVARDVYLPSMAREFDQSVWNRFLDNLHPKAVSNLRLRESNQNIELYNACMPSDKDISEQEKQDIIRKRSKLFRFFPLVTKHHMFQDSQWLDQFIGGFSYTTSQLKNLLKIPDSATVGFLKRAAGAPNLTSAENLDYFLRYGLKKEGDQRHYNNRVANIPLLHDKKRQKAMWRVLEALYACDLTDKARARIFLNTKNDWLGSQEAISALEIRHDDENLISDIDRYKDLVWQYSLAITDDLILPAYIKEFRRISSQKDESSFQLGFKKRINEPSSFLIKFDEISTKNARSAIVDFVQDALLSQMTPKKLAILAEKMERVLGKINEKKSAFSSPEALSGVNDKIDGRWHKIFPDQEINGIKFVVIDNNFDLEKEGRRVKNCVINLSKGCQQGARHVVSGLSETGEVFSVRFDAVGANIKMREANGISNQDISNEVREAVEILQERISRGEIALNPLRGNISRDFTIKEMLGFDFEKEGSVESVFEAYKTEDLLPIKVDSLESFYQAIDLKGFLTRAKTQIDSELKLEYKNTPNPKTSRLEVRHIGNSEGPRDLVRLD